MLWKIRAKIWLWPGKAAWHFVTLPKAIAAGIRKMSDGLRSPAGSVRVAVTVKGVSWKTSLFPAKEKRTYLLPIKAEVRKRAGVGAGDTAAFTIELEG